MLGSNIPATAKATVLGRALTIDHLLDPVEREIVVRIEERIPVPELIRIFHDLHVDEPAVIAALRSLLRRRLVRIDGLFGDRAP